MAAISSGEPSRFYAGPKASEDLSTRPHQELLEVPLNVTGRAIAVSHLGELAVERMAVVTVDVDLLEQWEGDAVGGRAERGDLFVGTRLLPHELVAGTQGP